MSEKRMFVRMAAVGGKQLKAELQGIGRAGQEAMRSLSGASKPANSGLQQVSGSAAHTLQSLETLAARALAVAASMRAAGVGASSLVERINQVTGVSASFARSAEDVEAYGRALDATRAQFSPLFAEQQRHAQFTESLGAALRTGAISSQEFATASMHEAEAHARATAAITARNVAMQNLVNTQLRSTIDRNTGVTGTPARSADDVAAYGKALDDMRSRANPTFGVIRQYRQAVVELRQAHKAGAISADEMTAAIGRERRAALGSIDVIKGRARALQQVSTGANVAAFRMQQMFFQVNDIGVSLAGGQNPFVVLAQQGTQISQIYGFGNGGASAAMRDFSKLLLGPIQRFPIVAAVIGVATAALFGMKHEINEVSDVQVSLGDTALAVFQVIGRGVMDFLRPALEVIGTIMSTVWDGIVWTVKTAINLIINGTKVMVDGIKTAVSVIPDLFLEAFALAASHVLTKLHDMTWYVAQAVNGIAQTMNDTFGTSFGTDSLSGVVDALSEASGNFSRAGNAAGGRIADAWTGFAGRARSTMQEDPAGEFFDAVKIQAVNNALARTAEEAKGAGGAGKEAAEEIATGWDAVLQRINEYATSAKDIGAGVGDALVGAFSKAEDAFAEFAKTGKFNFSDLISSMLADLVKLAARRFILGPIAEALGGALGGLAPGLGDSLIGYARGSYAGGGYTGNAPRSGGLDGQGGFMALLHPRETVVDHARGQNTGGGTVVQVIDQRSGGEPVRAERRRGPSGEEQVVLIVKDAMGRGDLDGAQRSRYGAQPKAVRR